VWSTNSSRETPWSFDEASVRREIGSEKKEKNRPSWRAHGGNEEDCRGSFAGVVLIAVRSSSFLSAAIVAIEELQASMADHPYSFLCQPQRMASHEECVTAARNSPWCVLAAWYDDTRVCDLHEPPRIGSRTSSRARDELHRCLRARREVEKPLSSGGTPPLRMYSPGSVAIVESMTANMFQPDGRTPAREEVQRTSHNIRCWARRHNYSLVLHGVAIDELRSGYSSPYGARRLWRGVPYDKINDVRHLVVSKYLERHGHVLHIDTDTIALREGRSLAPFLASRAAMQFQVRENGEVAAATYLARHSAEAFCFLQLWGEVGHATHRNPRPIGNTDNGVLMLLLARLLDEPTAIACEAAAVASASGGGGSWKAATAERGNTPRPQSRPQRSLRVQFTAGQPMRPAPAERLMGPYQQCFVERVTPTLLLHRVHRAKLPWLRFYFPREGWQRSFESPAGGKQHEALVSLQPLTDLLGHGWKGMGRLMVDPTRCAPLDTNRSRHSTVLTSEAEAELTVRMCWWLHRTHGRRAFDACSTRVGGAAHPHGGGGKTEGARVLLRYRRVGFGPEGNPNALVTSVLNISQRDAEMIFDV
jgi:hypothetical protein